MPAIYPSAAGFAQFFPSRIIGEKCAQPGFQPGDRSKPVPWFGSDINSKACGDILHVDRA